MKHIGKRFECVNIKTILCIFTFIFIITISITVNFPVPRHRFHVIRCKKIGIFPDLLFSPTVRHSAVHVGVKRFSFILGFQYMSSLFALKMVLDRATDVCYGDSYLKHFNNSIFSETSNVNTLKMEMLPTNVERKIIIIIILSFLFSLSIFVFLARIKRIQCTQSKCEFPA